MKLLLNMIGSLMLLAASGQQTLRAAEDQAGPDIDGTVTFFYYEQISEAAPFYGEVLGLPLTMDEDWVKIFRITASSSVGLVQQGRGFHEVAADKPAMLSMVVADVDAWYARLQAAGVTILKPLPPVDSNPSAGSAPVRGFVAEDPGGYTIEFFSWQR